MKKKCIRVLVVFLILFLKLSLFSGSAQSNPGDLDPTFGNNGKETINFPGYNSSARAAIIRPDGKILISSTVYTGSHTGDFMAVRLNTDGSIDNTFGLGGSSVIDFLGNGDAATWIQSQSDDKIILCGVAERPIVGTRFYENMIALARLNTNGEVDNTFGISGKTVLDILGGNNGLSKCLVKPDDKILIVGSASPHLSTSSDSVLVQYNQNGTLDNTFGLGGKLTTDFMIQDGAITPLLLNDGKIIVVGSSMDQTAPTPFRYAITLAKYLPNGDLDSSFGTNGKVITQIGNNLIQAGDAVLLPNNKFIVVGYISGTTGITNSDILLIKYNSDGSLDSSFGLNGILTIDQDSSIEQGIAIHVQSNGKILVAGSILNGDVGDLDFLLVRYNSDGTSDSGFGQNGKMITKFGIQSDQAASMSIGQVDGKILLIGSAQSGSNASIAIARYLGDPPASSPSNPSDNGTNTTPGDLSNTPGTNNGNNQSGDQDVGNNTGNSSAQAGSGGCSLQHNQGINWNICYFLILTFSVLIRLRKSRALF